MLCVAYIFSCKTKKFFNVLTFINSSLLSSPLVGSLKCIDPPFWIMEKELLSGFKDVENMFKNLNSFCQRLYDTITLLKMSIRLWALVQSFLHPQSKRQKEQSLTRNQKERERELENCLWAINITALSYIGLLLDGDPNNLYSTVGDTDFPFKRTWNSRSPGVQHPFAEMTFMWQMVQIAWHAS